MSKLNSITTCDFIDFDKALNTGIKLMRDKKTELIGFYIIVAINTGLRTSDIRSITFEQLNDKVIKIKEQKTNKFRHVPFNDHIKKQ